MKALTIFIAITLSHSFLMAEQIAPKLEKALTEEIRKALSLTEHRQEKNISLIRRGLISNQTTDRARCAQYLAKFGSIKDVPYLIDALSDESHHVGANYLVAGMATTRYWANVALISICKTSYDYRWDASKEDRAYSISLWVQHWNRIKPEE